MESYYCHPLTEIYPGLYLGGIVHVPEMVEIGVDVLIPLDHCPGYVLNVFKGEIRLFETPDYRTLPREELETCVDTILDHLKKGKKVGVFCIGGHGRTGYIAACVLGKLGVDDPIGFIRRNYCRKAVESPEQLREIASYIGQPELYLKYYDTV